MRRGVRWPTPTRGLPRSPTRFVRAGVGGSRCLGWAPSRGVSSPARRRGKNTSPGASPVTSCGGPYPHTVSPPSEVFFVLSRIASLAVELTPRLGTQPGNCSGNLQPIVMKGHQARRRGISDPASLTESSLYPLADNISAATELCSTAWKRAKLTAASAPLDMLGGFGGGEWSSRGAAASAKATAAKGPLRLINEICGSDCSVLAEVADASWGAGGPSDQIMEAPPGIEPGMEVLQTDQGSFQKTHKTQSIPVFIGPIRVFVSLRGIRQMAPFTSRVGQKVGQSFSALPTLVAPSHQATRMRSQGPSRSRCHSDRTRFASCGRRAA